jgi:hypothetical protein
LCTKCGTSFAVRNGIPELLPKFDATSTEDVFKQKEMVARDNEATRFESFYEQYHTNLETVAISSEPFETLGRLWFWTSDAAQAGSSAGTLVKSVRRSQPTSR